MHLHTRTCIVLLWLWGGGPGWLWTATSNSTSCHELSRLLGVQARRSYLWSPSWTLKVPARGRDLVGLGPRGDALASMPNSPAAAMLSHAPCGLLSMSVCHHGVPCFTQGVPCLVSPYMQTLYADPICRPYMQTLYAQGLRWTCGFLSMASRTQPRWGGMQGASDGHLAGI